MTNPPENHVPQEAPDSLVALLRKKRERQAAQRTRVFELPGYDDLIGARLRTIDELGILSDPSIEDDEADITKEQADALFDARRLSIARSCVEIVARESADDDWKPLAEMIGDGLGPVRFDQRLVEFLGGTVKPTDGVVDAVKFVMSKPLPFSGFMQIFVAWCSLANPLDDDEVVGESSAAS